MIVNHTVPNNEAILRRTLRIAYRVHSLDFFLYSPFENCPNILNWVEIWAIKWPRQNTTWQLQFKVSTNMFGIIIQLENPVLIPYRLVALSLQSSAAVNAYVIASLVA